MFWAEIWKISEFLSKNFQFLVVKLSIYLNRRVFVLTTVWKIICYMTGKIYSCNSQCLRISEGDFMFLYVYNLSKRVYTVTGRYLRIRHFFQQKCWSRYFSTKSTKVPQRHTHNICFGMLWYSSETSCWDISIDISYTCFCKKIRKKYILGYHKLWGSDVWIFSINLTKNSSFEGVSYIIFFLYLHDNLWCRYSLELFSTLYAFIEK